MNYVMVQTFIHLEFLCYFSFRNFGFLAPKDFEYFDFSLPDYGYSRNAFCTLN